MEPEQSKTQKPQRLWKVIFVISLALNMAVLGVVVGATWRFQGGGPHPAAKVLDSGSIYLRALDKKHRRELGRKMRPAGGKTKNSRAEIAQGFEQAIAVLRADRSGMVPTTPSSLTRARNLTAAIAALAPMRLYLGGKLGLVRLDTTQPAQMLRLVRHR